MEHLFHVLEPLAIIIGGLSVPIGFLIRWMNAHVVQQIKQIPELDKKVDILAYTLTVNGNKSNPPTILDRLQGVEKLGTELSAGQDKIKAHLSRQDADVAKLTEAVKGK